MTREERDAIRKWIAGETPKPPTFYRGGRIICTVTVPKEHMCWTIAHGGTYLRDGDDGTVVMEVPR